MPAVDLSRLRARFKLLQLQIEDPVAFTRGLREIFIFHADLTHPAGDSPSGVFTHPVFNTPRLLNSEVVKFLNPFVTQNPQLLLQIIDRLWREPEVELRELAAQLLGKLPSSHYPEVLARIQAWSQVETDADLFPFLHQQASAAIRQQSPELWLEVLNGWISSNEPWLTKLALAGTIPLIDDYSYENLPAIFAFINPLVLNPGPQNQYELLRVIEHLARRSEVETVYFLKQVMSLSDAPGLGRFLRRAIDLFSPAMQESLRVEMRQRQLT